jgi:hypothetical protein
MGCYRTCRESSAYLVFPTTMTGGELMERLGMPRTTRTMSTTPPSRLLRRIVGHEVAPIWWKPLRVATGRWTTQKQPRRMLRYVLRFSFAACKVYGGARAKEEPTAFFCHQSIGQDPSISLYCPKAVSPFGSRNSALSQGRFWRSATLLVWA